MIEIVKGIDAGYKSKRPVIKVTHSFTDNQLRELAVQAIETLGIHDIMSAAGLAYRSNGCVVPVEKFQEAQQSPKCEYVAVEVGTLKVLQTENQFAHITGWARSAVGGNPAKRIRIYKEVAIVESELVPGTVLKTVVKEIK